MEGKVELEISYKNNFDKLFWFAIGAIAVRAYDLCGLLINHLKQ